jgi:AraC-like DNA-binding protein
MDETHGARETNGRDAGARTVCAPEEEALQRLSMLDLTGARSALESLVSDALEETSHVGELSYLLYDVLGRIERSVAEHGGLPRHGVRERLSLVRRLHGCATVPELLARFWGAFEQATHPLGALNPPGHPAIEQVKIFVRGHYTQKIALAEIARAVGISRNYLSHLFKRHSGITVTEFIHRTRMKEAEKLLVNGRRSVSEIAFMVGYQNYRDFHRNFVKYEKTSPKKYRQYRAITQSAKSPAPLV